MGIYEMICFAKVYSVVFGCASPSSVSRREAKATIEVLEEIADNRDDWTQEQKESYKLLADFAKEYIEGK